MICPICGESCTTGKFQLKDQSFIDVYYPCECPRGKAFLAEEYNPFTHALYNLETERVVPKGQNETTLRELYAFEAGQKYLSGRALRESGRVNG